jgi:zinc transport system substrate-binding protein
MPRRAYRPILVGLLLVLTGSACDDASRRSPKTPPEKISVVATVYPLAEIARQVGGQYVSVDWLSEAGQALDIPEPSADVVGRMRLADFVINSSEPWAIQGFDDPLRAQSNVRMDDLPSAKEPDAPVRGALWLDPAAARELAGALYARFSAKRPSREPYFVQRRDAFVKEVSRATEEFGWKIESAPNRSVVVLSDDFNRLLWRFKVTPVKAASAEPTRLTSRELHAIRERAREASAVSMIVPADTPAAVLSDLADKTGLRVVPLDALGTSAAEGRNTYIALLRYDLEQLTKAVAAR